MSKEILDLNPKSLWNNFYKLTQVPRPSKHEERIQAFIKKFGEDLGLETIIDEVGNVIIRKPAMPGMENRKGVILQAHLDMVLFYKLTWIWFRKRIVVRFMILRMILLMHMLMETG
jgi:dipeptidase D